VVHLSTTPPTAFPSLCERSVHHSIVSPTQTRQRNPFFGAHVFRGSSGEQSLELLLPSIFPLFRPLRSPPPVIASTEVSELFYRRGCPGVNNALSFHSITSATPCGVLRTDPVVLMGLRKGAYNPSRNRYTCALVGSVFSVIALALCPGAMPGAHRVFTPPLQRTDAGPAAVIFPTLLVDFVLFPP